MYKVTLVNKGYLVYTKLILSASMWTDWSVPRSTQDLLKINITLNVLRQKQRHFNNNNFCPCRRKMVPSRPSLSGLASFCPGRTNHLKSWVTLCWPDSVPTGTAPRPLWPCWPVRPTPVGQLKKTHQPQAVVSPWSSYARHQSSLAATAWWC